MQARNAGGGQNADGAQSWLVGLELAGCLEQEEDRLPLIEGGIVEFALFGQATGAVLQSESGVQHFPENRLVVIARRWLAAYCWRIRGWKVCQRGPR